MTQHRSGKTLLEMVVVISMMAVILGITGTTLHVVMRSASASAAAFAVSGNRTRLARQFRSDAHAAQRAELVPDENGQRERLRLVRPDDTAVVYGNTPDGVVREVVEDERTLSREVFVVSRGETQFTIADRAQAVELAHLPIVLSPSFTAAHGPTPPELRVQAALGRDHRFLSASGQWATGVTP